MSCKIIVALLCGIFYLISTTHASSPHSAAAEAVDLANQGRHADAVTKFQDAIKEEPKNAQLHLGLGLAYQELKRYQESIKALEQAAKLAPGMVTVQYPLALLYEAVAINPTLIGEPKARAGQFWRKAHQTWAKVQRLDKNPDRQKTAKKHLEMIHEELREEP